jgi:hypothetical protein
MKKEILDKFPAIYVKLREYCSVLNNNGIYVSMSQVCHNVSDFTNFLSNGSYTFRSFINILLGSSVYPARETYIKEIAEIFGSDVLDEWNRISHAIEVTISHCAKPRNGNSKHPGHYVVVSRNEYLDGDIRFKNRHKPTSMAPHTTETKYTKVPMFFGLDGKKVLDSKVIEYGAKYDRDRYLNMHLSRLVGTQNTYANYILSSFDSGSFFPYSIPLHLAKPNFSRYMRHIADITFGSDKTVRLYPVRLDSDGIVYVIPMRLNRIRHYINAECSWNEGDNPHKAHFIRRYQEILNSKSSNGDSSNLMIFITRVVNGTPDSNGNHTAHWIRTPPQHGGGIKNVMAHAYGIPEFSYLLSGGRT